MLNRRELLIRSALLAAASLVRTPKAVAGSRERVVVVGAGMAGVAAARTLVDNGFTVSLLEARKEPGGRIRQDTSLGCALDLGGSFITTSVGNPLVELARRYGAETYNTDRDDSGFVDATGAFFSEKMVARAEDLHERLRGRIARVGEDLERDRPVQQVLGEFVESVRESEGDTLATFVTFLALSDISGDYAADPSEYSTRFFENDGEYSGPDLMVTSGYRTIIDGLARGLDIKTGVSVTSIRYTGSEVTVETTAGEYRCDRVIVTVPLGVLKRGGISFSPHLPESKSLAIERLGMGLLDKLYLKFPSVFWNKNGPAYGYFGNVSSLDGIEYPDFYLLDQAIKQPILLLFVGGKQARAFEQLSSETLVGRAMATLRRVYGARIPDPIGFIRTSWGTDPYAFGSYSFMTVGARPSDYRALAEPVLSRVFFAGEATERTYSASVHGAYISGLREARRIGELSKS